ncbi:acyl-CoA dehydrogenase family protein [Rhodococcus qingshengii]|uniref:acyl-CoA dehydrogenase family protein n=1 Tax=Rhodococcus qingshengii TaxID=334542 RepID=UPI001C24FBE3|nr:acyl-CoA dehydrogenase family protein [Rhodococcus qingshengii]QXC46480.1 acyl-CoA/acyl-ACP dehydrogenase [Rhodococcus qingshengii]
MIPPWTTEQEALLSSFVQFCRDRVRPALEASKEPIGASRERLLPLLRDFLGFGLGNGRVPVPDGGLGLDAVTAGLIFEAGIEHAVDVTTPAFINETVGLVLARHASTPLRERYLSPLMTGDRIGATANTESSGGSDVRRTATRATQTSDGYHLRGTKVWITNGHIADFTIVLARTDDDALDLFVVDKETHGYGVTPLVTNGSITTAELSFDVEVPTDHRLDTHGKGLGAMLGTFQEARALVALNAVGLGQAAQSAALRYADERELFGDSLAGKQLVQAKLADNHAEIQAARGLAYQALSLVDRGQPFALASATAKLFATEMAHRVADRALQIHGAYGTSPDFSVEKLSRLIAMTRIYEGPSDLQRLIIGKSLTGRAAF